MVNSSLLRTDEELTDLYARHIDTVYRICYTLLRSIPDAEDAAQSVFLKLMECPVRFENPAHERAWLIATAKNHCLDLLKHWWRRKRVELDSLPEPAGPGGPRTTDCWNSCWPCPPNISWSCTSSITRDMARRRSRHYWARTTTPSAPAFGRGGRN